MEEYKDIKDFFSEKLEKVKVDKRLIKQLTDFRFKWCTKTEQHIEFLGSNLLGVHKIIFSELDKEMLLSGIFKINRIDILQDDIYKVNEMEEKFTVASNIVYQVLMYTAYRFTKSDLKLKDKQSGIRECCLLMQYRMMSSLYNSPRFLYRVPEYIANTVYNKLSNKFLIKRLNNWQELFEYRVDKCLDKETVNFKQMNKYNTLESINLISAIQTKLRGNVNENYSVLVDVIDNDESIHEQSSTFIGGENDLVQGRERTVGYSSYINNITHTMQQPNNFIDNQTIEIVCSTINSIEEDDLRKFLNCMSDDKFNDYNKLSEIVEQAMLVSFNYLDRTGVNIEQREQLPKATINVRFYWSSSKVVNEKMAEVKKYLVEKARECTGRKTSWLLAALSIAYVLYIFLRSAKKE